MSRQPTENVHTPEWSDDALIVRCHRCERHPGASYSDGSGVCEACAGAAWIVLATREATYSVETKLHRYRAPLSQDWSTKISRSPALVAVSEQEVRDDRNVDEIRDDPAAESEAES